MRCVVWWSVVCSVCSVVHGRTAMCTVRVADTSYYLCISLSSFLSSPPPSPPSSPSSTGTSYNICLGIFGDKPARPGCTCLTNIIYRPICLNPGMVIGFLMTVSLCYNCYNPSSFSPSRYYHDNNVSRFVSLPSSLASTVNSRYALAT